MEKIVAEQELEVVDEIVGFLEKFNMEVPKVG